MCPECAIKMNYQRDKTASSIKRLKNDENDSRKRRRESKKGERSKEKHGHHDKKNKHSEDRHSSGRAGDLVDFGDDTMEDYLDMMLP